MHAYVDHSIIELIVNNDTAFVIYATPKSAATQGAVSLFGLSGAAGGQGLGPKVAKTLSREPT